jgi:hypothetical protein
MYLPCDFGESLDKCGVFATRMAVALTHLPAAVPRLPPNQFLLPHRINHLCYIDSILMLPLFLLQAGRSNVDTAANSMLDQSRPTMLLTQAMATHSHQSSVVEPFFWGAKFAEFEQSFPEHLASVPVRYSSFVDCFTGKACTRLRQRRAYWSHVSPFHFMMRAHYVFRRSIKDFLPMRPVACVPNWLALHHGARLRVLCSSALGALAVVRLSGLGKNGSAAATERQKKVVARDIMMRVCTVSCANVLVRYHAACRHAAPLSHCLMSSTQSSGRQFSLSPSRVLILDAREACHRNDIAFVRSLMQLSPELVQHNMGWETQVLELDLTDFRLENISHTFASTRCNATSNRAITFGGRTRT